MPEKRYNFIPVVFIHFHFEAAANIGQRGAALVSHERQARRDTMVITAIIAIAALAIFFTWNTNRAKNVIKARIYREYGYDPDIEKLSGAELMKMNDRMDEMGIR